MKTIFTLGPASTNQEIMSRFCEVVDGFRLNVAHLSADKLTEWLDTLNKLYHIKNQVIPVILDLQGAKMRIGDYPPHSSIPEQVTLFLGHASTVHNRIPVPHPVLFQVLQVGDILLLNDARIQLEITAVFPESADAKTLVNGSLSAYKGINRADHPVPFVQLVTSDQIAITLGLRYPFVQFACSFVVDGQEATYLRSQVGTRPLIAKIERPEALHHLIAIDNAFDELWFCRGDMGSQAGLKALGKLQETFVKQPLTHPKWLAGQLLEYMTHFPEPTRTEVVHLYDVMQAGFDGIVLSDETAIGQYPLQVAAVIELLINSHNGNNNAE